MKKYSGILLIVLCITVMLFSGCTNQTASSVSTPTSSPVTAPEVITIAATPEITNTIINTVAIPNKTETTIPKNDKTVKKVSPDYIITMNKSILTYRIDSCRMHEMFPDIGKNPNYGVQASPPKLTSLSAMEWRKFLREYMEGANEQGKTIGIQRCDPPPPESPTSPLWNFNEIYVLLIPRNSVPTNYEITIHLKSTGREVGQITANETLHLDQQLKLYSYIPIRVDEALMIDEPSISFN